MKFLSNMGGIGEENIFERASQMIENSQRASRLLRDLIKGRGSLDRIHAIKRESYELMTSLSSSVSGGAIAPNVIPEMLKLIELEYGIADMIFVLARSMDRYEIRNAKARSFMMERLNENNELVGKELRLLQRMHREDRISELESLKNQVKLIEEEGDDIKERMLSYAYKTKLDFKDFYCIINLAYIADDVLDDCEDSSDMITSIMLSIAT